MNTMIQEAATDFTIWIWMLLLTVLVGILLYYGYRFHYDKNMNASLLGKPVKKMPSIVTVVSVYSILAVCLLLISLALYTQPKKASQKAVLQQTAIWISMLMKKRSIRSLRIYRA